MLAPRMVNQKVPSAFRRTAIRPMREKANEPTVLPISGQPLGDIARAEWEPRFGHDFSRVRVRAAVPATEAAGALYSRALAAGCDTGSAAEIRAPYTASGY